MRTRKTSGFTLVELLVVIAIISILAAMLMPALQKALAAARAATCLSNQKQVGLGVTLYLNDWDGNFTGFITDSGGYGPIWSSLITHHLEYVNPQTMICPDEPPHSYSLPVNMWWCYGGRVFDNTSTPWRIGIVQTLIKNPSEYWFVTDSLYGDKAKQILRIMYSGWSDSQGGVHLRHNNQANTWFSDGHAEAVDAGALSRLEAVGLQEDVNLFVSALGQDKEVVYF